MTLLDSPGKRGRAKKSVLKQDRRDKAMRGEQIMKKKPTNDRSGKKAIPYSLL